MCGIVGFFNIEYANKNVLKSLKTIKNRGKDGFGIAFENKVYHNKSIDKLDTAKNTNISSCLGHCLHSIVGSMMQPIIINKGIIAINCEIYNWKELCKKHKINANNDAEMLLKLLDKRIDDNKDEKAILENIKLILDDLDGVYAFAYWRNDFLIITRDKECF